MFNKSKTSQTAKQTTVTATGLNSMAGGDRSVILRDVFGDKILAASDYTKPVAVFALAALLIVWAVRHG